jgi:hypothetical protein
MTMGRVRTSQMLRAIEEAAKRPEREDEAFSKQSARTLRRNGQYWRWTSGYLGPVASALGTTKYCAMLEVVLEDQLVDFRKEWMMSFWR